MKKILDTLADLQSRLAGLLFFIIFAVNMLEIISRSCFNHSFLWVSDFSTICVVWLVCLGMGVGVYQREHIFMELLAKKLPKKGRQILNIVIALTSVAFFLMLFVTGLQTAATKTAFIFPSIQWSLVWAYAALPVFAISSALFMLPRIVELFQGVEPEPDPEMLPGDVRFL